MDAKVVKSGLNRKFQETIKELDSAKGDVRRSYLHGYLQALDETLTLLRK